MTHKILEEIRENLDAVVQRRTSEHGELLWKAFLSLHPADMASLFDSIDFEAALPLFLDLPQAIRLEVFQVISHSLKVRLLEACTEEERDAIITNLSIDDLTDFLDDLSDEELQKYLKLLRKQDQSRVLSLLEFSPESAGGIMHTDVITLIDDLTVEKSIQILRRLQPNRDLHRHIYVVNQNNELVGHINLEDLVLRDPKEPLKLLLRINPVVVHGDEDRESVTQKMIHYGVSSVPVVDDNKIFLGVIPSEEAVAVVEEEASEDIYKMAALSPIKQTYFETPFLKLLSQRSFILIILLLVQTFSSIILKHYELLICGFFTYFISMLTSAGGNASSQTSALVIQGMATGEINETNSRRFIVREFFMALVIALLLGLIAFGRIYVTYPDHLVGGIAVSVSLFVIVLVSIMLGSCMPLVLKKFGLDPAHSAGPLLTTIIDVVGLLIYCTVTVALVGLFA